MNNSANLPKNSLHVSPSLWQEFRHVMLQNRTNNNDEVIGFLFCKRHQLGKDKVRYVPQSWIVPTSDCYERQSASGLVIKQEFHLYLLEKYLQPGDLDVVHIHTHAGESTPCFSCVDDRYESEYARFLSSRFQQKPRLISGVFDESLQKSQFRIWYKKGTGFERVRFSDSWFELPESTSIMRKNDEMFNRQKVFGETFQARLGQLTVTLIGCGGIGSVFAEQLGRLGVKKWVLVDPDRLERSNLNRMVGATEKMVDWRWHKVEYVKQLIKQIYRTGSCVKAIPTSVENGLVESEIAASDLIVVATDNHYSRQIAQELSLKYMRPLICLGTHIEVKPNGTPRMYCRVTVPPLGGGWCLMCGNIINLQRAALESAAVEIENMAAQAGYLSGINDPAVFWLNSICASTGVGIIQGMVGGFLNVDAGLDWIYEFPECKWHKTNTDYLVTPDCYFCNSEYRDSEVA
ncbi:MAG TPA: hypothetical protein DEG17_07275 [Cyanobacteria bacterium UBA11149]|nr:hypothetical protein [Cyanobacteria bacterium UBA11367]HBE59467.1 hypothetical protein [Cyanobacteria bacterium UBA11366]HBK63175.1 hypothetical protein [Cyanobacteria bacterium UBA11166]HBR75195.1 hypothetical protein [Cyanobacteria bacterium UBA11159]HBS68830.1 hypothetical protein [Cyanobacteria bacterium UBA11153]HBW88666.1 hypothetical protein [Cyanobacteria bacterium UBA11149]HCA94527.1 hypothetical protein [Cyanobacteria bacterium UBA9226]